MTRFSFIPASWKAGSVALERLGRLLAVGKTPAPSTQREYSRPNRMEFLPRSRTPAPALLSLGITEREIFSQRVESNMGDFAVFSETDDDDANSRKGDDIISGASLSNNTTAEQVHEVTEDNSRGTTSLNGTHIPGFSHGRYCYCTICVELEAGEYRPKKSKSTEPAHCCDGGSHEEISLERQVQELQEQEAEQRSRTRTPAPPLHHIAQVPTKGAAVTTTIADSTFTAASSPSTAATSQSSTQDNRAIDFNAAHAYLREEHTAPASQRARLRQVHENFEFDPVLYPDVDKSELDRAAQVPPLAAAVEGRHHPYHSDKGTYYTTPWEQWEQKRRQEDPQGAADENTFYDYDDQDEDENLSRAAKRGLWCWERKVDAVHVPFWDDVPPKDDVQDWRIFINEHTSSF
ncbi:hypothetical protein Micbo1qcDRAFT_208689 [Microdochium bolleyi]|uniref:Uncharacterized protein n=1 Tax=Microdochium bolleyi TaxID=196109 RepID=A0A136IPQ7_9PEZI|nr:hypothetical protein Micbo1qcDRAFT_208689 [Microdochium bolleyi]